MSGVSVSAAEEAFLTVSIGSEQTIREIAQEYLGDPDLWPEILRSSGIGSIADLEPGAELKIPVSEITAANKALIEALGQIQRANAAGAQIFAPDEIGRAVDLHEQALEQRQARAWADSKRLADGSYADASLAIEKSEASRDQTAEALVTDRKGTFEGQRPQDLSWRDLRLRAILIEEEKVRTLSDSTAQITFRDASRLRLNANSNAVIKEMRFDPWRGTEDAKVSLVEGDFYALLAGTDERRQFDVEIPQIDAVIKSGNFWVSNDDERAKFANYDVQTVDVAANGGMVTLGKNEGTVVERGEQPRASIAVLPPPTPLAPENESPVYVTTPRLEWSPLEDSAGYWVEIARDQDFGDVVENTFGVLDAQLTAQPLPSGDFFWRISALDSFGIPGERSPVWRFSVAPDETPPYLTITAPEGGTILRAADVSVTGESEPGAAVSVNGIAAEVDGDGAFAPTVKLGEGDNVISVVATDAAGNTSREERHVVYMPDQSSVVAFDPDIRRLSPGHFLTSGDVISLRGNTTANAKIAVRAGDATRGEAVADANGDFQINVPLAADRERLDFVVAAPSGFETRLEIAVDVDREGPEIALDAPLPWLTSQESLQISGVTEADAALTLNGEPLPLADGRFEITLRLQPGDNPIELVATDAVGNVSVDTSLVKLDQEPPDFVTVRQDRSESRGRAVLMLEVLAEDASGLAKAAPFIVTTRSRDYDGFLRFNKATMSYQGQVVVPEGELADARLHQVALEDDAGNTRVFTLDE